MTVASNRARRGAPSALVRLGVVAVVVGIIGSAATLGGAAARAEEAAPDKDLKLAKESFEAAQTAFVREEYEEAADKFLNAFEHKPFPAFLFNAAVAFEKAKRLDQAKEYFERYLAIDPGANDAAQVKARIDALTKVLSPPVAPPPPPSAPPVAGAPPPAAGAAPGTPPAPGAPSASGAPPPAGAVPPAGAPASPVAPPAVEPPALPVFLTKGLVVIDSKPQGATIYLNDK
ncbi:MAG TPA: tetratricopeptide repeat protein, partial [Polyangia bacterium]|nr:tetratricopeptide repeat protein [Polyangia bacterium]